MPPVSTWSEAIFDLNGRPLPGTQVTIYTDVAGTILAPVFTDATGATPQPGSTYTTTAVGDPTFEPGNLTVFAAPQQLWGRALGQNRIFPVVVPLSDAYASGTYVATLGKSNGTDDTAAINAVLANPMGLANYEVRGRNGENYLHTNALIVGSNTTLDLRMSTLTATGTGLANPQVQNEAATVLRSVVDAVTNGTTTITSATATFTAADVGRSVLLATGHVDESIAGGSVFTSVIQSFSSPTAVVVADVPSRTATGISMGIYNRDANVTIRLGATVHGNATADSVFLRRIDGLRLSHANQSSTGIYYAHSLADITGFLVEDVVFNSAKDGFHLMGPASRGKIKSIYGKTKDDFVAIGCSDYANNRDVQGSITAIEVDGIYPQNANGIDAGNGVNLFGGTGATLNLRNIKISGLYGSVRGAGVRLNQVNAQTRLDDITVDGVRLDSTNGGPVVLVVAGSNNVSGANAVGNLTIKDFHFSDQVSTAGLIVVDTAATARNLIVDGLVLIGCPTAGAVKVNGTCPKITVTRADVTQGASAALVQIVSGGQVSLLTLDDIRITGNSSSFIVYAGSDQTALHLVTRSIIGSGYDSSYPYWLAGAITHDLLSVDHGPSGFLTYMASGTTVYRVRGSGITPRHTTNRPADGSAGSKCVASSFEWHTDVSHSSVGKTVGDMCWNGNAALACGVGPVVCTGTGAAPNWKSLLTGLTY